ncbi:MAG TPA: L-threonylcarbamoyladenylate synthase [Nitrosopumilaceae archaeon]|nr:L-threonylcarbamoyladenylate synthase [Nitrosopumilaceae archaeon]HXV38926.1 L-threonylcarbamoyladenylate synthase [Nitrosopumilaceae archaeon]
MIVACDQNGINLAATTIKNGGVVVFPTDTVYGIGCDPRNAKAVEAIFRIKKRKESKQLPVLAYSKDEVSKIAVFDDISNKIADKFWPGQVTLVLKLKDNEIKKAMNLNDKVAVRVPNHPCVLALLKECKLIVGTSANFSGQPAFSDSRKVQENFSGYDVFLDSGTISNSTSSTIVEVKNGILRILRQGKITKEEIINSL